MRHMVMGQAHKDHRLEECCLIPKAEEEGIVYFKCTQASCEACAFFDDEENIDRLPPCPLNHTVLRRFELKVGHIMPVHNWQAELLN